MVMYNYYTLPFAVYWKISFKQCKFKVKLKINDMKIILTKEKRIVKI